MDNLDKHCLKSVFFIEDTKRFQYLSISLFVPTTLGITEVIIKKRWGEYAALTSPLYYVKLLLIASLCKTWHVALSYIVLIMFINFSKTPYSSSMLQNFL